MSFVNELISAADMAAYGIEAINARWNKMNSGSQWTIDRERDLYLREVSLIPEEKGLHRYYTLYWKGHLIELQLTLRGEEVFGGEGWMEYSLFAISVPDALADKRSEILHDLKDALAVFGNGGIYSTATTTNVTTTF